MAFDYNTKATKIKDILQSYNTTTASPDLSADLNKRIENDNIRVGDIETVSIRALDYPCIFIRTASKKEEVETIGRTGASNGLKSCEVEYEITALARKYGAWAKHDDLISEIYNIARNIEGVLRENITLSNTASWSNVDTTEFAGGTVSNGIFIQGCSLGFLVRYYFK